MDIKRGTNMLYVGSSQQEPLAKITYQEEPDYFIVDHTIVSDTLQGQGVAGKLLKEMIEFAKASGKRIIPVCSYAKSKMESTEEYQSMIYPSEK